MTLQVIGSGAIFIIQDAKGAMVSSPYVEQYRAQTALDKIQRQARVKKRPCLCCRETFKSEGNHNRLCNDCRKGNAGLGL